MRAREMEKFYLVDDLFYEDIPVSLLSTNKQKMKTIFDMGYNNGIKTFK